MNPLVSIVIPCWNSEEVIQEAIESALNQTYREREVIVVDDGSTDRSLEIIKSYEGLIRYSAGPNLGACRARNKGLSMAAGEFVQFLDADDLLDKRKLELQVPLASSSRRQIVYCGRRTYFVSDPKRVWVDSPANLDDPISFAISKIVSSSAPIYDVKALKAQGGYREDLACAQDYELHLRLAISGYSYRKLDEVLVTVRRRHYSVSSDSFEVMSQMAGLWLETLEELRKRRLLTGARKNAIAMEFARVGRMFYAMGQRMDGDRFFETADEIDKTAIDKVYDVPARALRRVMGAYSLEKLVRIKRRLFPSDERPL